MILLKEDSKQKKNMNKKIEVVTVTILLIAIGFYLLPLLRNIDRAFTFYQKNCINSWYRIYLDGSFYRHAILSNYQFPFWMPFREGGNFGPGYPTEISLNPLSIFILLFGVVKGLNLTWYALYIAGALSMYNLARIVLKYNRIGAFYSAIVFAMNGFFPYMQHNGFLFARETILLPLLVTFFLKSIKENKYILFTSIMLWLFFIQTGIYFCVVVLFLFLIASLESIRKVNKKIIVEKRYFIVFFVSLVFALLLSLGRLLPMLEVLNLGSQMQNYLVESGNTFAQFKMSLFEAKNSREDTMYIGYFPVLLCIFAGVLWFKRLKNWLIILFLFILLSLGPNSFIDLHYFLWHLPIFNSMIEISKYYTLIIVFLVSLISGAFFWLVSKKLSKTAKIFLVIIPVLFTYGDLLWTNSSYFNSYTTELPMKILHKDFFQIKFINVLEDDQGTQTAVLPALYIKGIGSINSRPFNKKWFLRRDSIFKIMEKNNPITPKYFMLPQYAFLMPSTKLMTIPNLNYKGEAFFLFPENKVEWFSVKMNVIKLKVNVKKPDRLIINQNYSKYLKIAEGKIEDYDGRISILLDKLGSYMVEIHVMPLNFYVGCFISMMSLSIFIWLLFKKRKKSAG